MDFNSIFSETSSTRSSKNRNKKAVSGFMMIAIGLAALWYNEGRFNYYQASKKTTPVKYLSEADPNAKNGHSFSGSLDKVKPLEGTYVESFPNFMYVNRSSQIYSWVKTKDDKDRIRWSKEWTQKVQRNSRNNGIVKTLDGPYRFIQPEFNIDDLKVTNDVYFVDDAVHIDPSQIKLSAEGKQEHLIPIDGYLYKLRKGNNQNELGNERIWYMGLPYFPTASYFGRIKDKTAVMIKSKEKKNQIQLLINDHGNLHYLVKGNRKEALETLKSSFSKLMWLVRIGMTIKVIFGLFFLMNRFISLFEIPFLSSFMRTGAWILSTIIGSALSATVIMAGMIANNPLLLFIPGSIVGLLFFLMKKKETKKSKIIKERLKQNTFTRTFDQETLDIKPNIEKTFLNLTKIALADNKLDKREKSFLVHWGKVNGLDTDTIKSLFKKAKTNKDKDFEPMTDEEFNFLIQMAYVDGFMSIQERHQINNAGRSMGKSKREISDQIKENLKPLDNLKKSDLLLKAG